MKLSIIIPMYGVEKYIKKCLMSCINQESACLGIDYEIICVNDGTKDKSAVIAREIAAQHSGITVIEQDNGGLSAARNTGTLAAKGEYIWYVDSDDYIEPGTLARILPKLKDDIDILHLHYRLVYENGSPSKDVICRAPAGAFSGKEVTEQGGLATPAPFSVLRSTYLREHDFKFVKGIYHEDMEYKPRVFYLAEKIVFDDGISYNYLQREGTIMSTFRPKRIYDLMIVVDNLLQFSQKHVDDAYRKKWTNYVAGPLSQMLYLAHRSKDEKVLEDAKSFVKEHPECCYVFTCSKSALLRALGHISKVLGGNLFVVYSVLFKFRYR